MGLQTEMQDSEPDEYKQDIHCHLISPLLLILKPHRTPPRKWTDASQFFTLHTADRTAALKTSLFVLQRLGWCLQR